MNKIEKIRNDAIIQILNFYFGNDSIYYILLKNFEKPIYFEKRILKLTEDSNIYIIDSQNHRYEYYIFNFENNLNPFHHFIIQIYNDNLIQVHHSVIGYKDNTFEYFSNAYVLEILRKEQTNDIEFVSNLLKPNFYEILKKLEHEKKIKICHISDFIHHHNIGLDECLNMTFDNKVKKSRGENIKM